MSPCDQLAPVLAEGNEPLQGANDVLSHPGFDRRFEVFHEVSPAIDPVLLVPF